MGRTVTAEREPAGSERRRKVERDRRGECAGAFVTHDPRSEAKLAEAIVARDQPQQFRTASQ